MAEASYDVVGVGEVMGLLDPDSSGPLEDVDGFALRIAGAEGNVLINLAHLGHTTAFISAVGADPVGRLVTRTLAEQGVNVDHVYVDDSAGTGVFFKERLGGEDRRVYYYREGSAASRLGPGKVDLKKLGVPKVLTLSGVTLGLGDGTGISALARSVLDWAAAGRCQVVFDPNLRPSLWDGARAVEEFAELLPKIDVLLAGREELAALVPGTDPAAAADRLCEAGLVAVVVKDGAKGAVVHEDGRVTTLRPYPVDDVVDPVGAGDAFAAGVISGLLHGWPVHEGAKVGAVLGARAVTIPGDWAPKTVDNAGTLLEQYNTAFGLVGERA
ncbi:MAG: 2-dehydro-3-deoxygluconokinase [Nocardioides sp.]|jgi:2-dehydro-3-deoxygluconokinase|nr:2-dehydro-3-deoxygluconokinase [Nocardioides sp.]